jgi:LPS-assembly lipoprotein
MSATVNYALYDRASGTQLTGGTVLGQASYDVPAQPYAAIRAEQDAAERATQDAAERLTIALARYLRQLETAQTVAAES